MSAPIATMVSLISMLLVWIGIFWLYRDFAVDSFRQGMFRVRDEMFDDARAGKISFSDAAYGMLRTTMNGSIRFAHVLSFVEFLVSLRYIRRPDDPHSFSARFASNLRGLKHPQQEIYLEYMRRVHRLLFRHLLVGSPLMLVTIVVPVAFCVTAMNFIDRMLALLQRPMDQIDDLAFTFGDDEDREQSHRQPSSMWAPAMSTRP